MRMRWKIFGLLQAAAIIGLSTGVAEAQPWFEFHDGRWQICESSDFDENGAFTITCTYLPQTGEGPSEPTDRIGGDGSDGGGGGGDPIDPSTSQSSSWYSVIINYLVKKGTTCQDTYRDLLECSDETVEQFNHCMIGYEAIAAQYCAQGHYINDWQHEPCGDFDSLECALCRGRWMHGVEDTDISANATITVEGPELGVGFQNVRVSNGFGNACWSENFAAAASCNQQHDIMEACK